MPSLQQQIAEYLSQHPQAITLDIAQHFNLPEGQVLCALPSHFVQVFPAQYVEKILRELPQWGIFTLIMEKEGSIFEIKEHFPSGMLGRGYYNLNMKGEEGSIYGHLKLDNIQQVAFVSLPFRGKESYNIAFIADNGQVVFKLYLGRDEQRQLFPQQIEKFNQFIVLNKENV